MLGSVCTATGCRKGGLIRGSRHTLEITFCVYPASLPISGLARVANVQAFVTLAFLWGPAHLSLLSAGIAKTPIISVMVIGHSVTGLAFCLNPCPC